MLRYTSALARLCDVRKVKKERTYLNCIIINWLFCARARRPSSARASQNHLINVTLATPVYPLFPAGSGWLKTCRFGGCGSDMSRRGNLYFLSRGEERRPVVSSGRQQALIVRVLSPIFFVIGELVGGKVGIGELPRR